MTKRKLNQDALDMFSEYYVQKVKEYETEQDNIKTKTIQKMVKEIKEMSILLRIAKRFVLNQNSDYKGLHHYRIGQGRKKLLGKYYRK